MTFVGWLLFTVSAVFFSVGAIRDGGVIELVASLAFLLACVVFLVPNVVNRPRRDRAERAP